MIEYKSAAAVVPRRSKDGFVLVGERTTAARSYPGYLAFPGGGMDPDDHELPLLTGRAADGERGCAMRELGEESGRWLIVDTNGAPLSTDRAQSFRDAVTANAPLVPLMRALGAVFDDRHLIQLGRWHTADARPRRFAVRQFLLEVKDENAFILTDPLEELEGLRWVDPVALRNSWRDGTSLLLPPIRHVVVSLFEARHEPHERLLERLRAVREEHIPESWELVEGVEVQPFKTPTLPPATHTNCVLLGSGDFLVVDPATPYDEERERFDALLAHYARRGRRPHAIFLTHHHHDHVSDAARVRERWQIPIWAHPETAARVPFDVDRTVSDGEVLVLAGTPERAFRAIHTPGHAPGHLCLLDTDTGVLVAGDMVAGVGSILIDPPEGHMGTYMRSLERLLELPVRRVIPAHGPLLADGKARLESHLAHRKHRANRTLEVLGELGEAAPEALVPGIYGAETPPAMYPLAARSVLATLELLLEEGRVTRRGALWAAS